MNLIVIGSIVLAAELVLAFGLEALSRCGRAGRAVVDALCRAPLLDLVVAAITIAPGVVGYAVASWPGLGAAVAGQVVALPVWAIAHELVHFRAARGPRLVRFHTVAIGRVRNHAALWISVVALPAFWAVRLGEILLYAPMRWMTGFPRYVHGDWINVSRQKFEGLVGHDLIWCLYCDWMTGVYALAGEMLRNVESFWCPIRFYHGKKCENCRIDFPDVDEWVPADGTMAQAHGMLVDRYGDGRREWFGHPARLTVGGKAVDDADGGS
ncbi:MAG: hypothetical protein ACYTJ0_05960 [Planctomycetota bacterium]|jgi:hypothetical protein